jgi:hypothetical protein
LPSQPSDEILTWRIGFPVVVDRRCFRLGHLS